MRTTIFPLRLPRLVGVLTLLSVSSVAVAAIGDDIANEDRGTLYAYGELVRGACNIDTGSRFQTLDMGAISTGELASPGSKGRGKEFHLLLRNCISGGTEEESKRVGAVVRAVDQPEVSINFYSEHDESNPHLLAVHGAKGFGLQLEDEHHHLIPPGQRGDPLVLDQGDNTLTYWLYPVRTREVLREGAWRMVVNMRFSYE